MGTHPIFESDFDCLTEKMRFAQLLQSRLKNSKWREATIRDNYKKDTFIAHVSETHSGTKGWEPSALPHRPIRIPHLSGVNGHYAPQLARVVIRLSPHGVESGPLRRWIDFGLDE